jgi:hypothetical protein
MGQNPSKYSSLFPSQKWRFYRVAEGCFDGPHVQGVRHGEIQSRAKGRHPGPAAVTARLISDSRCAWNMGIFLDDVAGWTYDTARSQEPRH